MGVHESKRKHEKPIDTRESKSLCYGEETISRTIGTPVPREIGESATFQVRVRPGAKGNHVGGTWGDDADGPLNVWVSKRAVDGEANAATIQVVAEALNVRRRQLSIIAGHRSRTKTLRVEDPPEQFGALLESWRSRARG